MSIEFDKLTPSKLAKAAILPQSLDNQWVPVRLLKPMLRKRQSLQDIKAARNNYILREWRRALIYSEQVVINRASMYNNDIVVDDYDDSKNRAAFKQLLARGDIVIYLFTEDSPDQRPNFDVKDALWKAWMEVVNSTRISCVRLDWGDQSDDFKQLAQTFHRYIQTLNTRTDTFMAHFKIPAKNRMALQQRFREVVNYASDKADQGKSITRNDIYAQFICADGTNVADGQYDGKKQFADLIKQIADLKYNVNLPDALGRYALTPEDSPQRSVLGDLQDALQVTSITDDNVQEILYSLRRLAFDKVAPGLYLGSLGLLTLQDVLKIREETDEWKEYRDALHQLLDNPLSFAEHSALLYRKFAALNQVITRQRYESEKQKWEPWVKFTILLGPNLVELWLNPTEPGQKFLTKVIGGAVATGATPFLLRMTVTGLTEMDADLNTSLDFMRGTIRNGRDTWREIENTLQETAGYNLLDNIATENNPEESNVNAPESFGGV